MRVAIHVGHPIDDQQAKGQHKSRLPKIYQKPLGVNRGIDKKSYYLNLRWSILFFIVSISYCIMITVRLF